VDAGDEGSGEGTDGGGVDRDGDGFEEGDDCDDTNAARNPDAPEYCNGVDDNCNGEIDEGIEDMPVWFEDRDGDGRGDPDTAVEACVQPYGLVEDDSDCDDTSSVSYPGAQELCDDRDNNCDGEIDEGTPSNALSWYDDADGDGFGSAAVVARACEPPEEGVVARTGDCDDGDAEINPRADEDLEDGVDNNCDGWVDLEGRYAGRMAFVYGRDRDTAGDYDCEIYWDTTGPVLLDPDELCYDCDFGFELTGILDEAASTTGSCGASETVSMSLAFGSEPRTYGIPVYYEFSYSYYSYYGYSYSYWNLWGYAEIDGYGVTYSTMGYVDRYSDGSYDTNIQYGAGSIY
jgi:hypothetical protein